VCLGCTPKGCVISRSSLPIHWDKSLILVEMVTKLLNNLYCFPLLLLFHPFDLNILLNLNLQEDYPFFEQTVDIDYCIYSINKVSPTSENEHLQYQSCPFLDFLGQHFPNHYWENKKAICI
jgi:hypothetical protein